MRPAENIEKLIKNTDIDTNAKMDKAVLNDVLKAFENSKTQKSAKPAPNIWAIIMKSRMAKSAAAAVMIVAVCLYFTHYSPNGQIETPQIIRTTDSPAELTTLGTLSFAYRQGGIEAIEEICDKALTMAGPRAATISVQELFEEFNGT